MGMSTFTTTDRCGTFANLGTPFGCMRCGLAVDHLEAHAILIEGVVLMTFSQGEHGPVFGGSLVDYLEGVLR